MPKGEKKEKKKDLLVVHTFLWPWARVSDDCIVGRLEKVP